MSIGRIKKFEQFSLEVNKVEINLLYSAITGLAIIKPIFFDFLEDEKSRYNYLDRNFWQSLILELNINKKIKVSNSHLKDIKHISIDDNWLELKQCIKVANIIRKKHFNIKRVIVNNDLIVVTETERIRYKDKDYSIEEKDIEKLLGFNINEIYSKNSWNGIVKRMVELMKMYLRPPYSDILQIFLDDMFEKQVQLNWDSYNNHKLKGLGEKVEDLPKLYYNNLKDFADDIIHKEEAFREHQLFLDTWKEKFKNVLCVDILKSLINDNSKKRRRSLKKFISKIYSIDDEKYSTFDKKLNIKHILSKQDFKKKKFKIKSENTFINENNFLVLQIETDTITLDITFKTKYLSINEIRLEYDFKA